MSKSYFVYIVGSGQYGTLYVGVTSDLVGRVWQHKQGVIEGFTEKYDVKKLVWFELHEDVTAAITREKQIKKWNRDWKVNLIQRVNPRWDDLYEQIVL
jgi:putative endonuclease